MAATPTGGVDAAADRSARTRRVKSLPRPRSRVPAADPASAARDHLLADYAEVIEAVLAVADHVAADWPRMDDGRPATTDRDAVTTPLRRGLQQTAVLDALPRLLAVAVDAAGYRLPAQPVAAPPYVAITSTGPVLRGTVDGGRLVVTIDCFDVVRDVGDGAPRYARNGDDPAAALSVTFKPTKN